MEKVKLYTYYIIIGIVSMIALVFLPMVGSSVGMGFNLPNTAVGWIVWITTKLIISVLNILIFYCFMEQAKVNVKENPNYKEANELLHKYQDKKEKLPRSPKKWTASQYGKKGTTIFFSTILASVALTQAILMFDWITMLTYLFTIIVGLIFGFIQMKSAEFYWTEEYYAYALNVERKAIKAEKQAEEDAKKETDENVNVNGNPNICSDCKISHL